jgi:hypothetical protein
MTSDAYPRWRFFPAFQQPPAWVRDLTGIFTSSRLAIDSMVEHAKRMESDDVLRILADDLETEMGFTVERGKKRLGKIPRPVFFGDEGSFLRTYEIDVSRFRTSRTGCLKTSRTLAAVRLQRR